MTPQVHWRLAPGCQGSDHLFAVQWHWQSPAALCCPSHPFPVRHVAERKHETETHHQCVLVGREYIVRQDSAINLYTTLPLVSEAIHIQGIISHNVWSNLPMNKDMETIPDGYLLYIWMYWKLTKVLHSKHKWLLILGILSMLVKVCGLKVWVMSSLRDCQVHLCFLMHAFYLRKTLLLASIYSRGHCLFMLQKALERGVDNGGI